MTTRVTRIVDISGPIAVWGMITDMITPNDDTPLWKQIDNGYGHGGGWRDFDGFEVSKDDDGRYMLTYPGDPAYKEVSRITFTNPDEHIVIFPYSWVLWVRGDEQKIARID